MSPVKYFNSKKLKDALCSLAATVSASAEVSHASCGLLQGPPDCRRHSVRVLWSALRHVSSVQGASFRPQHPTSSAVVHACQSNGKSGTRCTAQAASRVREMPGSAYTAGLSATRAFRTTPCIRDTAEPAERDAAAQRCEMGAHAPTCDFQHDVKTGCWFCAECSSCDRFVCSNCGHIQKPNPERSFFSVFGMKERYSVDESELLEKYRALQRLVHPDKYSLRDRTQQEYSRDQAMLINAAYTTLKSPLKRAKYLLRLKGHPTCEEGTIQDPEMLMQVMEIREQVQEASGAEQLRGMLAENEQQQSQAVTRLAQAFEQQQWSSAQDIVMQLTYLDRIHEAIMQKL